MIFFRDSYDGRWYETAIHQDTNNFCLVEGFGNVYTANSLRAWFTGNFETTPALNPEIGTWVGTYYPCTLFNGLTCAVSTREFDNPIDACSEAKRILIEAGKERLHNPTTVMCKVGPQCIRQDYLLLLSDGALSFDFSTNNNAEVDKLRACGRCGFPGHNTRTCTTDSFYDKVGIEIEGRYLPGRLFSLKMAAEADGVTYCTDGSILRLGGDAIGLEFQTKPGTVAAAVKQLQEYYPDQTDYSCGLHVHTSFKDDTYISQLSTPEFFAYFKAKWEEFITKEGLSPQCQLAKRLRGDNDYCVPNTTDLSELDEDEGDDDDAGGGPYTADNYNPYQCGRYRQLNFTSWGEHRTLECRLLPMFKDSAMSVKAIMYLQTIYQSWLAQDANRLPLPSVADHTSLTQQQPFLFTHQDDTELPELKAQHEQTSLEIEELPPLPEGARRMCLSSQEYNLLASMGLVA